MHQRILIFTAREFPSMPDHLVAHVAMVRYNRYLDGINNDPLDGGYYSKRLNGFHYDGCGIAVPDFVWVGKNGKTLLEKKVQRLERMEK